MQKHIECFFSDVSEHDMDMLFLEEFVSSPEFLRIFTDMVRVLNPKVLSVYSSKTDALLGESDITVVLDSNERKIGLLIENKIDAIAMPEQASRYFLRGQQGIERGDYDSFFVFIIAPKKYLSQNKEAQKYPNAVEYEKVLSYFEELNDSRSMFKIQQIKQAIEKQKKGYQVEMDLAVTEFWRKYAAYHHKNYPNLFFNYNGEIKGSSSTWMSYKTVILNLNIYHKTEVGFVDLTFDGCADKIVKIEQLLSNTIGDHIREGFTVQRTGKSAAVRLAVPIVNLHQSFEDQQDAVKICFEAIKKMSGIVKLFSFKSMGEFK